MISVGIHRHPPASLSSDIDAGGRRNDDAAMPHFLIPDPASAVVIQPGAVVSKVVHRGDGMNVTVFGFDSGEELTEHQSGRAAVVQVMSGRLRFTVDGEQLELRSGSWLQMAPGTPHSLIASEPTVMLLTLVGS
jgi:quercetin dioxygenase-like cupin family protein